MFSFVTKARCIQCGKRKAAYDCKGCRKKFCLNHFTEHQKVLVEQLDTIVDEKDLLKQTIINKQRDDPFIEQINQWEFDSIRLIQQTAQAARDVINHQTNAYLQCIKTKLTRLSQQIEELKNENHFNENNLNKINIEMENLKQEVNQRNDIEIREDSTLIKKLKIKVYSSTHWDPNPIDIISRNSRTELINQLNSPHGIDIDHDQTIYIADKLNHRIVEWKKDATVGRVVAGGNGNGSRNDQLHCPVDVIIDHQNDALIIADRYNRRVVRWFHQNTQQGETIISNVQCWGLAMDKNGYLYVVDDEKDEVIRWKIGDNEGTLVAGGNGKGSDLNQLDDPSYICIDDDESIYISDRNNHRVMKWEKDANEGIIVAGGQNKGNKLNQLDDPQGIFVDQLENVYIIDSGNKRIVCWCHDTNEGTLVIDQQNQLFYPVDLSFDKYNNLYVVDLINDRVQEFMIDRKK